MLRNEETFDPIDASSAASILPGHGVADGRLPAIFRQAGRKASACHVGQTDDEFIA